MKTSVTTTLLAICLLAVASPALADNTTILDGTLSQFNVVAQDFSHKTTTFAWRMLLVLSTLQLSINGIKWALKQVDLTELVGGITNSIFAMGVFAMFIQNPAILHVPIDFFTDAGKAGSGLPALTPSALVEQGIDLSVAMVAAFNEGVGSNADVLSIMKYMLPNLELFAASLVVIAAFAIIGIQMFLVLVQSYMWLCLTPIFMGFGGMTFTRDVAMNALKGGITIGAKILAVYFVAAVARGLAPIWANDMGGIPLTNWAPIFHVAIGAAAIAYLSFKIPALAGDMVNGTSSLSAQDVGSTLVTAMAAAAGAAAGAGGLASMTNTAAKAAADGGSALGQALGAGSNAVQDATAGGGLDGALNGSSSSSSSTPPAPLGNSSSSSPGSSTPAAPSSSTSAGSGSTPAAPSSSTSSSNASSPAAPSGGSSSKDSASSASSAAPNTGSAGNTSSGTTPPASTESSETSTPAMDAAGTGSSTSTGSTSTNGADMSAPPASPSPATSSLSSPTGDATNASIDAGGNNVSPPGDKSSPQEAWHKRVQALQGYFPNDGGAVGLNANLSHHVD